MYTILFLPNYSDKYCEYIMVMRWCNWSVSIAGYCLNFGFKKYERGTVEVFAILTLLTGRVDRNIYAITFHVRKIPNKK